MDIKVIKLSPDEINYNKIQLLISDALIVLTNGKHGHDFFEGTVIDSNKGTTYKIGRFYKDWSKSAFKLFSGEITIKQ